MKRFRVFSCAASGEEQQDTDVAQKARDLFGEETVHLIDEE
ncbi:hypothetical protein ACTMNS_07890 [Staphylococcus haemolyticus]